MNTNNKKTKERVPYALLFDVDGVLIDTPHQRAWMQAAKNWEVLPNADSDFDFEAFYHQRVSGEPGLVGAKRILTEIKGDDELTYEQRHNFSKKEFAVVTNTFREEEKQVCLQKLIVNKSFHLFDEIIQLIVEAKSDSIPVGVVSASENAAELLKNIAYPLVGTSNEFTNLYDAFDIRCLGTISHFGEIYVGKDNHYALAQGMMLQHCKNHGIIPSHYIVFEDAPLGIRSVKKIGHVAIGICRMKNGSYSLENAGADIVYEEDEIRQKKLHRILADIRKCQSSI